MFQLIINAVYNIHLKYNVTSNFNSRITRSSQETIQASRVSIHKFLYPETTTRLKATICRRNDGRISVSSAILSFPFLS